MKRKVQVLHRGWLAQIPQLERWDLGGVESGGNLQLRHLRYVRERRKIPFNPNEALEETVCPEQVPVPTVGADLKAPSVADQPVPVGSVVRAGAEVREPTPGKLVGYGKPNARGGVDVVLQLVRRPYRGLFCRRGDANGDLVVARSAAAGRYDKCARKKLQDAVHGNPLT